MLRSSLHLPDINYHTLMNVYHSPSWSMNMIVISAGSLQIFYFYDVTADVSYEYYNMTVPQRYGWMAYCSGGTQYSFYYINGSLF